MRDEPQLSTHWHCIARDTLGAKKRYRQDWFDDSNDELIDAHQNHRIAFQKWEKDERSASFKER